MTPYYQDEWVRLYCEDCAEVLPQLERHDLLLTDPPYGQGLDRKKVLSTQKDNGKYWGKKDYPDFSWDKKLVPQWLLSQAIAKCRKAIVFGGNFYDLGPANCWLVWDKDNGTNGFADCELAWTNLDKAVRMYRHLWNGICRKHLEARSHPTQKPVDVMSWCLGQCAEAVSVLDPFAGSGTTLVAAKLRNLRATGIEREERYCEIAANRLSQGVLNFGNGSNGCHIEEPSLWETISTAK